jgi:hypothetical protein
MRIGNLRAELQRRTWIRIAGIYATHFKYCLLNIFPPRILRENGVFRNKHDGETCFILGSGPSIKEQNIRLLQGKTVITQNNFHQHPDIAVLDPAYHIVVDRYMSSTYESDWEQWFSEMGKSLPRRTALLTGIHNEPLLRRCSLFNERRFFFAQGLRPLAMTRARIDLTRYIMDVPTVITACLSSALYMGFKNIYLSGFDLNQVYKQAEDRRSMRFYGLSAVTRTESEKNTEDQFLVSGYWWLM